MAELPKLTGFAGAWLSARREELNARFRVAKRRFTKLDAQAALALNAEFLPPLAGDGEPGADELLSETFDLVLLHSGRGLLTAGRSPLRTLLGETFPRLRALLLQRPRALAPALSNAVENAGAKGQAFARAMGMMGSSLQNAAQLRDAGAVLAWRLGEARLREAALDAAETLSNVAILCALGLDDWPAPAAPLAVAALKADAWCHPRERICPQSLAELAKAPASKIAALAGRIADFSPTAATLQAPLLRRGTCGEFAGFGGSFLEPPKLLNAGKQATSHRFWLRSGTETFRLDADVFGWVCKPDAAVDFPVQKTASRVGVDALKVSALKPKDGSILFWDGSFFSRGKLAPVPALSSALTFVAVNDVLAVSQYDSFRIRIFSPTRPTL